MYECPNCGGNLKFDISSQKMFCAHCESRFDPYSLTKGEDAEEGGSFEANVFLCPQCGGEMISGDNDITSFCSYCGAANILSSRISREKRPRYIIPFMKTKEECKRAYEQKLRKAFFAPKELKDPQFIEGFRGIYMPYWSYRVVQRGEIQLDGYTSERKGDYVYTNYYALKGDLDAGYEGYAYDASSSFYDNISEGLAPYDAKKMKDFSPAFLSGFYADRADVDAELYQQEALEIADNATYEALCKDPVFEKYGIKLEYEWKNKTPERLLTVSDGEDSALFPVWFLCYRNGDRVAYAAVNGQTGKVVADIPVDEKKFFASSLILAIPIFILLNLFLTLRPKSLLDGSALVAAVSSLIYYCELGGIFRNETRQEDRAIQKMREQEKSAEEQKTDKIEEAEKNEENEKKEKKKGKALTITIMLIWIGIVFVTAGIRGGFFPAFAWLASVITVMVVSIMSLNRYSDMKKKKFTEIRGGKGCLFSLAAVLVSFSIRACQPVSDLWYYGGVLAILATVIFVFTDLIRNYNKLTMRSLPQFEKKGGDDSAE